MSLHHRQLNLPSGVRNEFVEDEYQRWTDEEVPEDGVLDQSPHPVEDHEDVPHGVGVVYQPEGLVHIPTGVLR